ncbi:MAG: hypothetical protein WBC91_12145 [Phototrophicaceae bacterium]
MDHFILTPKVMFILFVWVLFIIIFLKAMMDGKVKQKQPRRLWLIFFLCCAAFTFWGESSELALDRFFNDQPVALLIKYLCLVGVANLFHSLLNDVRPNHALIPIKWLSPVAIIAGLTGFALYNIYKPFPVADLRFLYIGGRDFVVLVYALMSFIPGTLSMRQNETVGIMRSKLTLIIMMTICFVVTAIGSIIAAILTILQIGNPASAASAVQPFVILGIIFFVLIMIPYRWSIGIIQLKRFYTCYRLQCLENRMLRQIGLPLTNLIGISALFEPKELELAIYRSIISVLDFYPMLIHKKSDDALYAELQTCIKTTSTYDDLIQKMAQL